MGCCQKIIEAATGLAKAALGLDAAPLAAVLARRNVYRACDRATRSSSPRFAVNKGLTTLSRCLECSCFIAAKTLLSGEKCPMGKWCNRRASGPTTGEASGKS
jgi:hypothetical protein